jgi:DNA-binding GntR family transcriptional regulator
VAEVDEHTIVGVFELREVLEGLAARHAATSLTTAGLAELECMVAEQRQLLCGGPDEARDALADLRFHAFIRDFSPNDALRDALARLEAQSHLHRSTMWALELNRQLAVREHAAIVAALQAGDPAEAARAASSHVAGLRVRMTRRPS